MTGFVLTPEARCDLAEIERYLARTAGKNVARSLRTQFFDGFAKLAAMPQLGHRRPDLTAADQVRFFRIGRYLVVYRTEDRWWSLGVSSMAHGTRRRFAPSCSESNLLPYNQTP